MNHRFSNPIPRKRESSYGSSFFQSYSRKLSRLITAFSNIEFDNLIRCEMDSNIAWYCERPAQVDFYYNGKNYILLPSLYVEYLDGGSEFQWVNYKDKGFVNREIISLWSEQSFEHVEFIDENVIIKGPYSMRNLNYLYAKARRYGQAPDKYADKIITYSILQNPMTIGQLIARGLIDEINGMSYLADLFYRGIISFNDIDNKTISLKTEVRVNAK